MKKLLLVIFCFCVFQLSAQKRYSCVVEYENGKSRELYFDGEFNSIFGTKANLIFYEYMSKEKIKINIEDIKNIRFNDMETPTVIRYAKVYPKKGAKNLLSTKKPLTVVYEDDKIFIGKVKEQVMSKMAYGPTTISYVISYYIQGPLESHPTLILKHEDKQMSEVLFKMYMKKYVKDCPQLVERVKKGEFYQWSKKSSLDEIYMPILNVYKAYIKCKK